MPALVRCFIQFVVCQETVADFCLDGAIFFAVIPFAVSMISSYEAFTADGDFMLFPMIVREKWVYLLQFNSIQKVN